MKDKNLEPHRLLVRDKIVGKAAANLCCYAGIKELHAVLISKPGLEILRSTLITVSATQVVSHILNHNGTDLCPFEKLMRDDLHPDQAFASMKSFFKVGIN